MIIKEETKHLKARYKYRKNGTLWVVQYIYHGIQLIWQNIRSCFGKGIWYQDKPWVDTDFWKN